MSVIKMTDLDLASKRVFIRADLNVPVKDGKVTSDARIRATIPTLKLALEKGAKVMVTSHLGRPTEGEFKPEDSLQPVVDYLKDAGFNVRLEQDYLNGVDVKEGEIVVLENVRVNKGEKAHLGRWMRSSPKSHAWIQLDNLFSSSRLVVRPGRHNGQVVSDASWLIVFLPVVCPVFLSQGSRPHFDLSQIHKICQFC